MVSDCIIDGGITMARGVVSTKWRIVLIGVGILVLMGMGIRFVATRDTPCFVGQACYGPELVIDEFIREYSGLPKVNLDLSFPPDTLQVYPVANWEVANITVAYHWKFWDWVIHGSGAYLISAEVGVEYVDGERGILLWDSWHYGFAYGNLVICGGDGPPGFFTVIDLRQDTVK
jgi:hypothetical protein